MNNVKKKEPKEWNLSERDAFKRGMLAFADSLLRWNPDKQWIRRIDVEHMREVVAKKRV